MPDSSKNPPRLRYTYKTPPYSHQKKALKRILDLDGVCALFMEMGTGKTKVAIDWASICYYNKGLRRVLVVAPLSVLSVWKREIRKHSPVRARIAVLQGPTREKARLLRLMKKYPMGDRGIEWVIINYESTWRETGKDDIEALLRRWKPQLVIADESHRIKSASAKQSRTVARIGSSSPMRLALTGTPITKSPLDLFGQFRFLNSETFGTNYGNFKNRYGVWGGYLRYQLRGYKNLTELTRIARAHSYRIRLAQCFDLPVQTGHLQDPNGPNFVPVNLSERGQEIYRKMAKELIVEFEEFEGNPSVVTARIVLTKMLRLSQITSGFLKDENGRVIEFDNSKLTTATDLISDMVAEDEKVVVFVRFVHDYQNLAAALASRKIKSVILSGSVPQSKRDGLLQEFSKKNGPSVFIAQIASGSVGIDLTAARLCIFYSWDYNYGNYTQAVSRIHRHGQTKACTYYHLAVPGSIDTTSLGILKEKGNIAHAVIHDPDILRPKFE